MWKRGGADGRETGMADCRFLMHARGTQASIDELMNRMLARGRHAPRLRSVHSATVAPLDGDRGMPDEEGRLTVLIEGVCSCSLEGSMCRDEQTTYIRSFGWGGTIGGTSAPVAGETTLERTATETGTDIEAYSFDVDVDDGDIVWEHAWYSADGSVSVLEDTDELRDEWGEIIREKSPMELVWHV